MPINLLLADDTAMIRAAIRRLLQSEPEIAVVGEAHDLPSLEHAMKRLDPHVIVLDLNLAPDVTSAITRWKQQKPKLRIVIITAFAQSTREFAEVDAFLDKVSLGERLVPTLKSLAAK
jgi:DNA-binding NarL/FixJ family response regulator